jgi:poly(3-hydroxybutyrate) depolymerase
MKAMHLALGTIWLLTGLAGRAADSQVIEAEVPAGTNYALATFFFWHPPEAKQLRGVVVLVPGSNDDGRAMAQDSFWQAFARRHQLGLVGCCFKDHPHENMNIEEYARAGAGSGAALLEALTRFAKVASRPEVANASLLLWGHSAGGEFNYEFACWKPERVMAFVVNKGGYYFTHLAPPATRKVPGIFFVGGKDEEFRILSIRGIFAGNHRAGAAWKLVSNPGEGHEVGQTRDQAVQFFEETLAGQTHPR